MKIGKESEPVVTMLADQLQAERIRVLYKQVASVLVGNVFIASLLTVFLYVYTDNIVSIYWIIVVLGFTLIRYVLLKTYYQYDRDDNNVIFWGWVFALTAFISGCTWGATSLLFLQTDNLVIMLFLLMTLTGITVGSSASLSNYALSYYAFSIPALLPFAFVLGSEGEAEFIILSMMLTVFLILQLVVAKKNQQTLDKSIILGNENVELVQQLKIKKEAAERANSSKTKFLAAASHDLRQPLHAMSLLLDVLAERGRDSEQSDIVDKIKRSSLSLESLLTSLLDISKLDAGVIKVDVNVFRIQSMFDVLQPEFRVLAEEKGLKIHFVNTSLSISSDRQIIERIIRNLISNAIRYTEQGNILIGCRRKKKSVVLSVYDTGIGIDKKHAEIIFEEFHQLENHSRDRSKGLGLGLSIVKRLVEILDIDLKLRSEPAKGSVFSIECQRSLENKNNKSSNGFSYMQANLAGKTIIVIEDEKPIRDALNILLSGWGCRVYELESISEINEKLTLNNKPDMIVADYRLRFSETGVDVIHALHQYFKDTNIPAVIITGDTAPERLIEVEQSGFYIMHKPVAGGKLRAVLNSMLG